MDGQAWTLLTVVGPILLAVVILWAMLRNRNDKRGLADTERATRELYEAQDRQDKAAEDKVQR